jgi:hypothetical protein
VGDDDAVEEAGKPRSGRGLPARLRMRRRHPPRPGTRWWHALGL